VDRPAALVVNNISMHECRDIDLVTENVLAALGFTDPGSASLTPMHALTWARRPTP
jgi:hypothetical protein